MSAKRKEQLRPVSEWPENRNGVKLLVWDGPNQFGKLGISMLWWQGDRPRGQVARSTIEDQRAYWEKEGRTVEVAYEVTVYE